MALDIFASLWQIYIDVIAGLTHYCPEIHSHLSCKLSISLMKKGVSSEIYIDAASAWQDTRIHLRGGADAQRQTGFCPTERTPASRGIQRLRGSLRGQLSDSVVLAL